MNNTQINDSIKCFKLIIDNTKEGIPTPSSVIEAGQFPLALQTKFLAIIRSEMTSTKKILILRNRYYMDYYFPKMPMQRFFEITDLLIITVDYLSFKDQRKVQRTSKTFNAVIKSQDFPKLLSSIKKLDFKTLKKWSEIMGLKFSEILQYCTSLKALDLSNSPINDAELDAIMKKISPQLIAFSLSYCTGLQNPPDLSACTKLQVLYLTDCTGLQNPPDLSACTQLRNLDLFGCTGLQNLPDVSTCIKLRMSLPDHLQQPT